MQLDGFVSCVFRDGPVLFGSIFDVLFCVFILILPSNANAEFVVYDFGISERRLKGTPFH